MDEFKKELENVNEDTSAEPNVEKTEQPIEEVFDETTTFSPDFDDLDDDEVYFEDDSNLFEVKSNNNAAGFDVIDVLPVDENSIGNSKKGIKVFCLIMAVVIALSGVCLGGYYMGKNTNKFSGSKVLVDLSSKPKETDEYTPAQVYDLVNASIVGIRVYNQKGEASDVSGVIYSKDGYVVTNDHSYSEVSAPKFKVFTFDGQEYDAEYVAGDTISDLAVLKIVGGKDFKPAEFGDSREITFGENVVAIGRPSDATADSSISKGVISAVSRRVTTTSSYSARLIQTDSAINPGSSGGALVNMYGQVIGITASKLAGAEYDAVGFAIPTVTMKRVVEQLIANGRVIDRAKLGISYNEINSVTADIKGYSTTGLYIADITEDSDLYGKVEKGSIITHINGQKITNDDMVLDVIEDCKAGDSVSLTILFENGSTKDFTVKLKANVGQSSYSEKLEESNNSSSDGTFDFPFGE